MSGIPFVREIEFDYGTADTLSPLIRRVIAKNPGPFTYTGTGTYIIGRGQVAVIDPGPRDETHFEALMRAVDGETVSHILITHTHNDHSPLARELKAATGAKTYGYGPHGSGKADGAKVEEGGDMEFAPDVVLRDGDVIQGDGWTVEAVHTPGHTSNHICFGLREENVLFTGDHVMGWSTSVIVPPDGNMADYFASLRKLLEREDIRYWPTHGPAIENPQEFVRAFIHHREARELQILACLTEEIGTIPEMVRQMYKDVDSRLHPAAARSVHAHLIHMVETGRVLSDNGIAFDATYRLPNS